LRCNLMPRFRRGICGRSQRMRLWLISTPGITGAIGAWRPSVRSAGGPIISIRILQPRMPLPTLRFWSDARTCGTCWRLSPVPTFRRRAMLGLRVIGKGQLWVLGMKPANARHGFGRLFRADRAPIPHERRPHHTWQLPVIDEPARSSPKRRIPALSVQAFPSTSLL
jgi:hypothetical protein